MNMPLVFGERDAHASRTPASSRRRASSSIGLDQRGGRRLAARRGTTDSRPK